MSWTEPLTERRLVLFLSHPVCTAARSRGGANASTGDQVDASTGDQVNASTSNKPPRQCRRKVRRNLAERNLAEQNLAERNLAKRDNGCRGKLELSRDHAVDKSKVEALYNTLLKTSWQKLPDDWNSLEFDGLFLSWSSNSRCFWSGIVNSWCKNRFDGRTVPPYDEVRSYATDFLNSKWDDGGWGPWGWFSTQIKQSALFRDATFGGLKQAVCISDRAKGCSN